jgi:hypothetical protein
MRKETILNPDTMELIDSYPGSDNEVMLRQRQAALDKITGPKVGDYIRTIDSRLLRFTINSDDSLQAYRSGSFYLGHNGCDFSGACGDSYRKYRLIETGERKEGSVWFFDGDQWGAGRGHNTKAIFTVWEEVHDMFLTDAQWKQRSKSTTNRMVQAVRFWGIDFYKRSSNY